MAYVEFEGDVRPLGPGVLTVGSAPEAGWRILGRGLEPVHVLLSVETGGRALLIRGAPGSTARINGVELTTPRALLSFGDRVQVGTVELRYRRLPGGPETAPAAYLHDTRRGRVYRLRDRGTIGRDPTSTVTLQEPDVSRVHAHLVQGGESYVIVPHAASVTSVNGKRLLAPAGLQEGDEIAVGRTVLRFTTALPTGARVAPEPTGVPAAPGRESRTQTTFMGAIEVREQRSRVTHRRIVRAAAIAMITLTMAAVVVTLYADARTPSGLGIRSLRPSRRRPRPPGAPATLPAPPAANLPPTAMATAPTAGASSGTAAAASAAGRRAPSRPRTPSPLPAVPPQ
jgi:predicted component of type VI protein secretion system